jgi:PAS domain S-box-containing protein
MPTVRKQPAMTQRKRAEEALHESDKRLRLALDVAELGTWTWDLTTGTGEIDARGAEIVGLEPGTVPDIAAAQRRVIHPDDIRRVEAEAARGIASREIFTLEYRVIRPDGSIRYIDSRAVVMTGEAGRPIRVTGTSRDVTRERTLEAALRSSEARHALLLRLGDTLRPLSDATAVKAAAADALGRHLGVAAAGYIEVDPEGDMVFAAGEYNDGRVGPLTGWYRLSTFGGIADVIRRGGDVFVEDFEQEAAAGASALGVARAIGMRAAAALPLMKRGTLVAFVYAVDRGRRRWSTDDRTVLREVAERTWAAVERTKAEANVRDTEARLQSALDASNMGTFVWHAEEDRTEADLRMVRLFGLPPDGEVNLRIALSTLLHVDDREPYALAVGRALDPEGPGTLREDIRVVYPDGTLHWLAVNAQAVFEESPRRAVRLVGTIADITARKSTEQALRESEERLKESDRRKDEFLAMLAHELRNPLAPIRTGLELLRIASDTTDVERVRAVMERQVGHMVRLIDDLLDVSRITSGKIQLQRRLTPLAELVDGAVEANRAAASAAGVQLTVQTPDEPCLLDVDPTRVVQVFSNLLHNAVKFTPSGGRIGVSAACGAPTEQSPLGDVTVSVADSGIGISRNMLPRVFDLFTQGRQGGQSQPGLGIGLAVARQLIEMHGGHIEAMSQGPSCGSTFVVRLPIASRVAPAASAAGGPSVERIKRRVLIVEDNEDVADMLAMLVEELGGEARVARDGYAGVKSVVEFQPGVVLLDIGLPGMDGYETCRRIRSETAGQNAVVVALTGWGQEQDKQRALAGGFDAHLTKPADPAALARILATTSE